jgi:CrcB protein
VPPFGGPVHFGSPSASPRSPGAARSLRCVNRLVAIALGGVLGSLARYGLSLVITGWASGGWPWATFTENVLGCVAIGIIASSATVRRGPDWLRPFAITGILGGFTTFSAFALETGLLLDAGRTVLALAYVVATMVVGLLAVRVGSALADKEVGA